jgi:hypothetical protein
MTIALNVTEEQEARHRGEAARTGLAAAEFALRRSFCQTNEPADWRYVSLCRWPNGRSAMSSLPG